MDIGGVVRSMLFVFCNASGCSVVPWSVDQGFLSHGVCMCVCTPWIIVTLFILVFFPIYSCLLIVFVFITNTFKSILKYYIMFIVYQALLVFLHI